MKKGLVVGVCLIVSIIVSSDWSCGAGFAVLQQGSRPMGQGNAFVAQADDPSAVFFNPAGTAQLEGTQAYLGGTFILPRVKYDGYGTSIKTVSQLFFIPQAYITHEITPQIFFGFGANCPFGLSTDWGPVWEGRYLTTYNKLRTFNVNPNITFKNGKLALSAGFDAMRGDITLRKMIPLGAIGDGESEFTGDAWGYGYNLGLLYEFNENWKLGISYRSKIELDFDNGKARFAVPLFLKPVFPDTRGSGELGLPPSFTGGISFSPDPRWTLEFDVAWMGWSTYDDIKIRFQYPVRGSYLVVQPKRWEDVFAYRFGLNYRMSDRYIVRCGYIFDQTPVPDSTMDPMLPDADRHVFTAGIDWKFSKAFTMGMAYNYIHGVERAKHNLIGIGLPPVNMVNWDYSQRIHSVGFNFNYAF